MTTKTPSCRVIVPESTYEGKQALTFVSGVSAETVGAQGICMHLITIPPGGRAKAHLHENHETAIYMLQGEGAMWFGDNLEEHCVTPKGSFIYIPAGVPHLPYNPSESQEAVALVARTDPNEQESVVLLPELEALHP